MRIVFQLRDRNGTPQGGHVFEAPDDTTLQAMVDAMAMGDGWTAEKVAREEDIIAAPASPVLPPVA